MADEMSVLPPFVVLLEEEDGEENEELSFAIGKGMALPSRDGTAMGLPSVGFGGNFVP
jgi:hypothetical protein